MERPALLALSPLGLALLALLVRETDIEPDRAATRVDRPAVGGFHDPRPAAAAHEKALRRRRDLLRPFRHQACQLAGFGVVAPERSLGPQPRRAEEHDGVVDALLHDPHHDGSPLYVDQESAPLGAAVRVRVRTSTRRRVDAVWLRTVEDGEPFFSPCRLERTDGETVWWSGTVTIHNPVQRYRFMVVSGETFAWLNAAGVFDHDVTDAHDAVVLLDNDPALLHVGEERFRERLEGYLEIAEALRQRIPDIDYVDLRFEQRVYVKPRGRAVRADVSLGSTGKTF